jgi:predicted HTH transcriptional regulator
LKITTGLNIATGRAPSRSEIWRRNLHNLYDQITGNAEESKLEQMEQRIFKLIVEKGPITKREAYQNIRGLDSNQASILIDTLVNAGLLQALKQGRADRYTLSVDSGDNK